MNYPGDILDHRNSTAWKVQDLKHIIIIVVCLLLLIEYVYEFPAYLDESVLNDIVEHLEVDVVMGHLTNYVCNGLNGILCGSICLFLFICDRGRQARSLELLHLLLALFDGFGEVFCHLSGTASLQRSFIGILGVNVNLQHFVIELITCPEGIFALKSLVYNRPVEYSLSALIL